jgi:hypothetical protein
MDHLYPLDAIDWNWIYGPRFQHQCVPPAGAAMAIGELLSTIARHRADRSRRAEALAILRQRVCFRFRPGDAGARFPDERPRTLALFDELDVLVLRAGGALYPAKDAHMSAETFQRAYPQWRQLDALRDSRIMSAFWERVTAS